MTTKTTVIHGDDVMQNEMPQTIPSSGCVSIPGNFHNRKALLNINPDDLSKHILLIGGTGCGKTNVFYFFVDQIKKHMTESLVCANIISGVRPI